MQAATRADAYKDKNEYSIEKQQYYIDKNGNRYDVDTKQGYERDPDYGGQLKVTRLTKDEVRLLYLGAREMFGSFMSHGVEKFKCESKG